MSRPYDSREIDLAEIFLRVQTELLAQFAVGRVFEHAPTAGAACEKPWIDLLNRYLPQRYRAAPAFVVDSEGCRSCQIDIAIFDNLYSPLLFPHSAGLHIPAESVYAVFEVKTCFSLQWLREAAERAETVRSLKRTSVPVVAAGMRKPHIRPRPILAGLLGASTLWTPESFPEMLRQSLGKVKLDIGCCMGHGSFERTGVRKIHISHRDEALIFFLIRLVDRLREMGTAPAANLKQYARGLRSFR